MQLHAQLIGSGINRAGSVVIDDQGNGSVAFKVVDLCVVMTPEDLARWDEGASVTERIENGIKTRVTKGGRIFEELTHRFLLAQRLADSHC